MSFQSGFSFKTYSGGAGFTYNTNYPITAVQLLESSTEGGLLTENNLFLIEIQKAALISCFQEDAEYSALKRQKIIRFKALNPFSYQKLADIGIDLDGLL